LFKELKLSIDRPRPVSLWEPPGADPHARWCGGRGRKTPGYPIDRIEIVRGPSSAIYGSEATGGVVNIITRAAARQPEAEIEVRGGVGQAAEQSIQAMAGSAFGPLRSTIAVSHAKQDGYDTDIST
ncbi:TonB-dependent receptor plug domain-containing protein, partial [Desulfobulbus rhabdoformis]|uniref:TonB-dependent receptor plug domain-containing protein n=1 Tax=Desulfobulbus rhabdoformis TaxID=34032 RepID=UPI0019631BC3